MYIKVLKRSHEISTYSACELLGECYIHDSVLMLLSLLVSIYTH